MNYLNAASFGPPSPPNAYTAALRNRMIATNYLPNQASYGLSNCCNPCLPPCNTQTIYENSCGGGGVPNTNMNTMSNGCPGNEYNTDTDDDYNLDNYYNNGGYGTNTQSHESTNSASSSRHTQLLNGYSSPSTSSSSSSTSSLYGSSKPSSFYQVSSPVSSPFLVDSHPYSPTGSMFATSHMHHFGSYPSLNSNPFQQYFGTLNAYPNQQRFNYGSSIGENELNTQNLYNYNNGSPFGPMFDYASTSEPDSSSETVKATTSKPKETIAQEDHAPIENVFHIVKPNFASLKKAALMKKHRNNAKPNRKSQQIEPTTTTTTIKPSTLPSTTTKMPLTTTIRNILVARKMAKILIAKKSSTPAPKTTPIKTTTLESTTKLSTTTVENTTKKAKKIVTSTIASSKKLKFS